MEFRRWQKLAARFYGPFRVEKKISAVAYRLSLPAGRHIFPVFHITLLNAYKGDIKDTELIQIPPLTLDVHPADIPSGVLAYRRIIQKARVSEHVLVDWHGMGVDSRSW